MSTHVERERAANVVVYERVVRVYDMKMPNGKIYRWDDTEQAERFAIVNQFNGIKVKRIHRNYKRAVAALIDRTTPDALVRRSVRKQVKGLPHEVQKD